MLFRVQLCHGSVECKVPELGPPDKFIYLRLKAALTKVSGDGLCGHENSRILKECHLSSFIQSKGYGSV